MAENRFSTVGHGIQGGKPVSTIGHWGTNRRAPLEVAESIHRAPPLNSKLTGGRLLGVGAGGFRGLAVRQFLAYDRHIRGGVDPQSHDIAVDFDQRDRDVVAKLNPFAHLPAENQHESTPCFLRPGPAMTRRQPQSGIAPSVLAKLAGKCNQPKDSKRCQGLLLGALDGKELCQPRDGKNLEDFGLKIAELELAAGRFDLFVKNDELVEGRG